MYGVEAIQAALRTPDLKKFDREVLELPSDVFGHPRAPAGVWASCIRILNPIEVRPSHASRALSEMVSQLSTVFRVDLDNNEAAFSLALVPFAARDGELLLVVGTAKDTFLARAQLYERLSAHIQVTRGRSQLGASA